MGWGEVSPQSVPMSHAQRMEINRLRADLDGVRSQDYDLNPLPPWTKSEAVREIARLREKLVTKRKSP